MHSVSVIYLQIHPITFDQYRTCPNPKKDCSEYEALLKLDKYVLSFDVKQSLGVGTAYCKKLFIIPMHTLL